jgi:hypothetical protein
MDCDEEELQATKNREKTADELFTELGYRMNFEDKYRVNYENIRGGTIINIDKDFKNIRIWNTGINMQELQAINKKVKELNW